ncbi:MAG: hypothetical protein J5628_08335, partial [Lachnospiraceae bacterium]|nr:hypothetical protein [Lachnospiraceae bacterium]
MKKANVLLLLLVVLTALCLAGCGKDDDGDSSKNKTEVTATPTDKAGDTDATPTAKPDEPTGTPKPTIPPEEAIKTPVWKYEDKNFEAAIPKSTAKAATDPVGTSYTRYTVGLCK